jgi:hypothetical protein
MRGAAGIQRYQQYGNGSLKLHNVGVSRLASQTSDARISYRACALSDATSTGRSPDATSLANSTPAAPSLRRRVILGPIHQQLVYAPS